MPLKALHSPFRSQHHSHFQPTTSWNSCVHRLSGRSKSPGRLLPRSVCLITWHSSPVLRSTWSAFRADLARRIKHVLIGLVFRRTRRTHNAPKRSCRTGRLCGTVPGTVVMASSPCQVLQNHPFLEILRTWPVLSHLMRAPASSFHSRGRWRGSLLITIVCGRAASSFSRAASSP